MKKNDWILFLAMGIALLFLEPVTALIDSNLGQAAQCLVMLYWSGLGICWLFFACRNLFADCSPTGLLYNLWLFSSLMSIAVGILAVIDEGPEKTEWALWLILYGTTVVYLKRKEL
jgi:hypothetical protein